MLDGISNALSGAANSITGAAANVAKDAMFAVAEKVIKEHTGLDIEVTSKDIPHDWVEWISKTGVNSLCSDWTWWFMKNERKASLFRQRDIKKIVMTVDENPDPDYKYDACTVFWDGSSKEFTVTWLPRGGDWESDNTWLSPGYKKWWNIGDEIEFALQLYQLPGKCFYKSDWLGEFEDVDPNGLLPSSTTKFDRWFQHRHWVIFWYGGARWGWNWEWTTSPPPLPDGSDFSLDAVLKLPTMPDLKMPTIKLPSLPDVSMPSLPDVSMPSISAPSLSAPSLSAPDLSGLSMPSIPKTPKRPKNPWAAHGIIEINDLKACAKGKKLTLHNATVTNFFQEGEGNGVRTEKADRQKLELEATSAEQAESWLLSLKAVGVVEADPPGCCVVA